MHILLGGRPKGERVGVGFDTWDRLYPCEQMGLRRQAALSVCEPAAINVEPREGRGRVCLGSMDICCEIIS